MSWRDILPVHPAADLFPMMSDDELKALGEDIAKRGIIDRIVFWEDDSGRYLLDGRNRLEAASRARLIEVDEQGRFCLKTPEVGRATFSTRQTLYKYDPFELVVSFNVHRRT